MLVSTLIVVLILDVAWITYAILTAPVIDDDDNFITSNDKRSTGKLK